MYIDIISTAILFISLALSFVNIYFLSILRKQLSSNTIDERFKNLSRELSLVHQKQLFAEKELKAESSRLEACEKILSCILTTGGGGFNPNDGSLH
tara:strand:- start:161 stop:448 length:288 start_codon:yes stop_codon:yes gene_type:complete